MNKIYKVKYNAKTRQYTAVSEIAKSSGKSGRVVTSILAMAMMPFAMAAGPDGVSNDRPSYWESRISASQADGNVFDDFRANPSQYNRYHINSASNENGQTAYYGAVLTANQQALLDAGVSQACIDSNTLTRCGHSDRAKTYQYTADYAIDAIKLRDSEIAKLQADGTMDNNYVWHDKTGGSLDLTPGGDNNKDVYTLKGGSWDAITLNSVGYPYRNARSEFNVAAYTDSSNTDKNSGLYRDLYVDHATVNVENSALLWSRETSNRSVLYVTDDGKVNFKGKETIIYHTQSVGHAVRIGNGRENTPESEYAGNVDVAGNFTVLNFNSVINARNILIGDGNTSLQKESSALNVKGNLKSLQYTEQGGAGSVNIMRSGVINVDGTTDLRSIVYRYDNKAENQAVLRVQDGKFYGQGNVNIGFDPAYYNAFRVENVQGIYMMGGTYLNDAKTTIELPASQSYGYIGVSSDEGRSFGNIKGGIQTIIRSEPNVTWERWNSARTLGNSTGIQLKGGDMHVGDTIDVDMIFLHDSKGIELLDGELVGDKDLDIYVERKNNGGHERGETNNTAVVINGTNAHLAVAGNTKIEVNTQSSQGVLVTKGEARLGDLGTRTTDANGGYTVNSHNQENAVLDFSKGSITMARMNSNAVVLAPEDGKTAKYTQASGTLVKTTDQNSNGILIKQADNTSVNFDVTIDGKVEQTGANDKDSDDKDQYAAVNLSGTGQLTASNTAEILNNEDQVAILKRDNGDITADVAAKVIGRVMLTGQGTNSLTLSENADSEVSNMKVIDGGEGGNTSTLVLKSGGYLLNAYTDSNAATEALPTGQTVSQLLNWDTISLDTTGTTDTNFVRLNLVGDTSAKDKVEIGQNNWLTKRETQNVTLTTASLVNNGTIDLRNNSFNANNKLTVTGDYVGGTGSRLLMSTNWNRAGMDENGGGSQSDLLHIQGSASGSTQVIPTTKDMDEADNRILGDVAIQAEDMVQVGTEVKTLQSQTATENTWLYTTNFAKRINTVVVVQVDGQDDGSSFTGTANVDDGTEVQLASRATTNGGREYYWTMYGERQVTRTETEAIPTNPQSPPLHRQQAIFLRYNQKYPFM